ncbi:hypothetical protein LEMLEM_LOCUS27246 [Lemmus lemmus]
MSPNVGPDNGSQHGAQQMALNVRPNKRRLICGAWIWEEVPTKQQQYMWSQLSPWKHREVMSAEEVTGIEWHDPREGQQECRKHDQDGLVRVV